VKSRSPGAALLLSARLAISLIAVFGPWPSTADDPSAEPTRLIYDRNWIPYSKTARAITGNIWLTPTTITFDGRFVFDIRYLSEAPIAASQRKLGWGDIRAFRLYEIVRPETRELLNGNSLCGAAAPARYLAIGLEGERRLLLVAFTTEKPPDPAQENGLCGWYSYLADEF
jgi:hypothetical protein